ncbi:hypothetical protein FOL47_010564, partial [Perkinsus chesapeaki]
MSYQHRHYSGEQLHIPTGLDHHSFHGSPALAPCKAELHLPDGRIEELPILEGSHGDQFIDIRNLSAHTGLFSFDPGFSCTASCSSAITYIDGPRGDPIKLARISNALA